jgi:hypothetical protein
MSVRERRLKVISRQTIEKATADFFKMFWNNEILGPSPEWQHITLPFQVEPENAKLSGCFIVFEGSGAVYIGLAASQNIGLTHRLFGVDISVIGRIERHTNMAPYMDLAEDCGFTWGMMNELNWHVLTKGDDKWYRPQSPWIDATELLTIGFTNNTWPVAKALEIYLVQMLQPRENMSPAYRKRTGDGWTRENTLTVFLSPGPLLDSVKETCTNLGCQIFVPQHPIEITAAPSFAILMDRSLLGHGELESFFEERAAKFDTEAIIFVDHLPPSQFCLHNSNANSDLERNQILKIIRILHHLVNCGGESEQSKMVSIGGRKLDLWK